MGPASVVGWLRSAAIPLATVEPRHGYKDLEGLRAIIGDARILSLGEATHGTREFFQLKHRIIEFCVAALGFTIFGIEAGFPESIGVNAYVLDGVGTAADALSGLRYWVWQTEEVLDLIEWMRWWNVRNSRKVKFYGFDMANPPVAALELIDFLARVEPELAAACKAELAPLTSDFTASLIGRLPDARRQGMLDGIARVLAAFERQRPRWIAAVGADAWHIGRLQAAALDQSTRFLLDRTSTRRDRAMAENVCALLEAEGPGAKAVLWSHNDHAMRSAGSDGYQSMGKALDEMVGRSQVVVGFSFARGSFQARAYPNGEVLDHSVAAADPDSLDAVLAQAGLPLFVLDVANAPRTGVPAAWLASRIEMRSIGGIYGFPRDNTLGITYTRTVTPREEFDAVLFVAETTAARPNTRSEPPAPPVVQPAPVNLELAGDGIPAGWRVGGRRQPYTAVASDVASPRGGRTVCVSRDAIPQRWGDGFLSQRISVRSWRAKRLRLAAAVRTEAHRAGAGAFLSLTFWRKIDPAEPGLLASPLLTVSAAAEPIQTPQWATYTVEADVPDAADSVVIGLGVMGHGAAWFGDLEFSAVPRPD